MKKNCFVIMGFGKKMDYHNSKEIDLDIIYDKVIKSLFFTEFPGDYQLIRADEIMRSEIIDVSMYQLLMQADLVIADITTLNANALYELGIRHALRPYSTIIMMQGSDSTSIPFDLKHARLLTYKDYGESLDDSEAAIIKNHLKEFVKSSEDHHTDSPLYTYFPDIASPHISKEAYETALESVQKEGETIAKYREKAESLKKENNFSASVPVWESLHNMLPSNEYITQQLALACYKSELPNKSMALLKALEIINTLTPETSLDLETLGITGAIYKRLYDENKNFDYLDRAIKMYRKGYIIKNDYYNGENYANCLLLMTQNPKLDDEEKMYLRFTSKHIYRELIEIIQAEIAKGEINFWMYATLAISYYCTGNSSLHKEYETLFLENLESDWNRQTYFNNKNMIKECLNIND